MSCCPPSITPDFADNGGGGAVSGVQSVVAGTNITISGTPTNPQINANAGVSAVEGLQGSINLNGIGCTIGTSGQDINITVPPTPPSGVQTVAITGAGLSQTGTASNPILQNTGLISLATTGGGLLQTGTASAPILQNTGVLSITTPINNGSGLAITNGGVGAIQMSCLVKSGVGCTVRPSTLDAQLFVDNNGVLGITGGTGISIAGTAQNPIINSSGASTNRLVITSNLNFAMPTGATMINITLVGGGGGGGGGSSYAGGGGGGSGRVYTFNSLTLPAGFPLQFIIGTGGAGGGLTTSGAAGFDTILYTTFSNPTLNTEIGRASGGLGGQFATSGFSGQAGAGGAGGYGGGGGGCSGINTNYGAGGIGSQPSQIIFSSNGSMGNNTGGAGGYNNQPQFATLGGSGGGATGGQGFATNNGILGGGGRGGDGSNLSGAGGNGYAVLEWF